MTEPAELTITYTLRELLERMELKLGQIMVKLDGKADRADVESVRAELDEVRAEVADIKLWRAKVVGIAAGVGALVGSGAAGVLRLLG